MYSSSTAQTHIAQLCLLQRWPAVGYVPRRGQSAKGMQFTPSPLHHRLQTIPSVLAAAVACCWIYARKRAERRRHAVCRLPSIATHFTYYTICASPSVVLAAAVACCWTCAQKRAEHRRHAKFSCPSASQPLPFVSHPFLLSAAVACC